MDYVVHLKEPPDSLAHFQRKGAHWGVVTQNVGKYYIPKGERGQARAEKRYEAQKTKLENDAEKRTKKYTSDVNDLLQQHRAGKIDEEQFKKKAQKVSDKFEKDKDKFERRAENLERMADRLGDAKKSSIRNKKMSDLSDEELEKLMKRTNQEKVTYNNLKQIREHEEDKSNNKSIQDLVRSAKDLNQTVKDINREIQKNPPTKKQKTVDLSDKTDAELRRMIERAQLEQRYNDVVNKPEVDTGKIKVAAAISAIGTAAVVGTQVVNFVSTAKQLKN